MPDQSGRAAAAYIRVSDPRMVERYSLPAQRDLILAHCARQGWPEPAFYVEEGKSALSDDPEKRPQFRALLADAEARRFATVIVVDLDRFARSTLAALTAASRLERAGCRIVSLNQPGDFSTPDGELMFTLHASVARYESRQKGRRVKAAIARMRAEGRHYGTRPYGATLDDAGRLQLHPATAPILERILREAATTPIGAVADGLTRDGIPSPQGGRPNARWGTTSGHWWASTIVKIIAHGAWLADQPEPWPALWLAALNRPHTPRARKDLGVHMMTGLMRCPCGGSLLYGGHRYRPSDGHFYGRTTQCLNRKLRPGGTGCRTRRTYIEVYEAQVVAQVAALPDAATWTIGEASPLDHAAWRELAEDRRRLREAYRARLYTDAEFEAERQALDAREAGLVRGNQPIVALRAEFARVRDAFPQLPEPDQNAFLRLLADEIYIDGHTAVVRWKAVVRRACGLPEPPAPDE